MARPCSHKNDTQPSAGTWRPAEGQDLLLRALDGPTQTSDKVGLRVGGPWGSTPPKLASPLPFTPVQAGAQVGMGHTGNPVGWFRFILGEEKRPGWLRGVLGVEGSAAYPPPCRCGWPSLVRLSFP